MGAVTAMVFITDDDDDKDMKDAIIFYAWPMRNEGWIREGCRVHSHYRVRYT